MSATGNDGERVHKHSENLPANTELGLPEEKLIWKGTTWPCGILSPMFCSSDQWYISNRRIDMKVGTCGLEMDTIDIRRIVDLRFDSTCCQMCCCRGTLVVCLGSDKEICITTFGMREVYDQLRDAWLNSRTSVAVDVR